MNMEELEIRKAKFEELDGICRVLDEGFGDVTPAIRYWWRIMENSKIYTVVAVLRGEVIGTASLHVLEKLLHTGSYSGLIEDVSVLKGYAGEGVGQKMIDELVSVAKEMRCYKVILNCDKKLESFYEKCGFEKKEIQMRIDM